MIQILLPLDILLDFYELQFPSLLREIDNKKIETFLARLLCGINADQSIPLILAITMIYIFLSAVNRLANMGFSSKSARKQDLRSS